MGLDPIHWDARADPWTSFRRWGKEMRQYLMVGSVVSEKYMFMTIRAGADWSGTFSSTLGYKTLLYSCTTPAPLSCSMHQISHFGVLLNVSGAFAVFSDLLSEDAYTFRPHWHTPLVVHGKGKPTKGTHEVICSDFWWFFWGHFFSFFNCSLKLLSFSNFRIFWPCFPCMVAVQCIPRGQEVEGRMRSLPGSSLSAHKALPSYLLLEVSFPLKEFFLPAGFPRGVCNQPTPSL